MQNIPPPPPDLLQMIAAESVLGKSTTEKIRNCWTTPNTKANIISLYSMFLNKAIGIQIPIAEKYPKDYTPIGLVLTKEIFPDTKNHTIMGHKYIMLCKRYYPIHDVCGYTWYPFTKTMKRNHPNLPQIFAINGGF